MKTTQFLAMVAVVLTIANVMALTVSKDPVKVQQAQLVRLIDEVSQCSTFISTKNSSLGSELIKAKQARDASGTTGLITCFY